MSNLESFESPQMKLVNEWIREFKGRDPDLLVKRMHKDFRLSMHPRSLGVPEINREEWVKIVAEVFSFSPDLESTTHSVMEAPGKIIFHVTTKMKSPSGVDVDRESIYITHVVTDEDGSLKIKQNEEFTDSKTHLDLFKTGSLERTPPGSLPQTSDLETLESPQLKLVNEFDRGFRERDVNLLGKHLHKGFRRFVYPKSLGMPDLGREDWLKKMAEVFGFATGFSTTNHSVIEAPGKVLIYATTRVQNQSGTDVDRESVYITHLVTDEDGSMKIKMFEEFTDSQVYLDLFKAAAEAGAKAASFAA